MSHFALLGLCHLFLGYVDPAIDLMKKARAEILANELISGSSLQRLRQSRLCLIEVALESQAPLQAIDEYSRTEDFRRAPS